MLQANNNNIIIHNNNNVVIVIVVVKLFNYEQCGTSVFNSVRYS